MIIELCPRYPAVVVEAASAGPHRDLVAVAPVGHVALVPGAPLAVVTWDLDTRPHGASHAHPGQGTVELGHCANHCCYTKQVQKIAFCDPSYFSTSAKLII